MKVATKKKLFNPEADEDIKIFGGSTSNILNLATVPKDSERFHKLVDVLYSNNWLPQKVSMSEDKSDYKNKLTADEREVFDNIISFLAFLDSIQTNNLPNIADFTTDPHFVYALARQTFDEANHSKSYGWILSSLMSREEANRLYNKWKENKTMLERNKYIADIYQDFVDKPTDIGFLKVVIANYMLEGIYFYNGFQFFHNLANRGACSGTDTQISYIERDEKVHTQIFEHAINNMRKQNPSIFEQNQEMIDDMFLTATQWEIDFSVETIGNKILGMSVDSVTSYSKYRCDTIRKRIGMDPLYNETKNVYKHLEKQAGVDDETSNRTNNFEETSITYKSPEILEGWDDL